MQDGNAPYYMGADGELRRGQRLRQMGTADGVQPAKMASEEEAKEVVEEDNTEAAKIVSQLLCMFNGCDGHHRKIARK